MNTGFVYDVTKSSPMTMGMAINSVASDHLTFRLPPTPGKDDP
jgi:hypothetical protein